jgi:hypothetical protein
MIYGSQQIGNTNAGVAYIPLSVKCEVRRTVGADGERDCVHMDRFNRLLGETH